MNIEEIAYNELSIDLGKTEIKDDKLYVVAVGLTPEFVPLEVIERDSWTFNNKEVRFRHKLPEEDVNNLIGHIHETWVENEQLMFLFEIWGHRKQLEEIQEQIINNELEVSSGYKKTFDNSGVIVEMYGREISVTPIPKCTKEQGCGVRAAVSGNGNQAIVMNEKNNVDIKMSENEKVVILENDNKRLVQHNKERGEMIESLESTIETLEDKVMIQNKTITEQNETITSLEDEVKTLKEERKDFATLDIRSKIVELEGITDEEGKKDRLEKLKGLYNEDQLTDKLESLERTIKHASKSGRIPPVLNGDTEGIDSNEDNLSDEEFAMKHFPNLKAQIGQNK